MIISIVLLQSSTHFQPELCIQVASLLNAPAGSGVQTLRWTTRFLTLASASFWEKGGTLWPPDCPSHNNWCGLHLLQLDQRYLVWWDHIWGRILTSWWVLHTAGTKFESCQSLSANTFSKFKVSVLLEKFWPCGSTRSRSKHLRLMSWWSSNLIRYIALKHGVE